MSSRCTHGDYESIKRSQENIVKTLLATSSDFNKNFQSSFYRIDTVENKTNHSDFSSLGNQIALSMLSDFISCLSVKKMIISMVYSSCVPKRMSML